MTDQHGHTALIASWLEPELVERIRAVDPRLRVIYHPELLRPPRYPADHTGQTIERTVDQEQQWQQLLAEATILFDFDRTHLEDLPELAPKVGWVQATSAGIGELVRRWRYAERMPNTVFTTARGVHAQPLAEFAVLGMLLHSRRLQHTLRLQQNRHWERFAGTDLAGRTVLIVGLGAIGSAVARLGKTLGMTVLGIRNRVQLAAAEVDELRGPEALADLLPRAEFLVLVAPHTNDTEGMIGSEELRALPAGAVLINIGRGALVDETALLEALKSGRLGGACLDVFAEEPLPPDSPLWSLPNVLISPHSASTSDRENRRLTDLFCDNLNRYLQGRPLRNMFDPQRSY